MGTLATPQAILAHNLVRALPFLHPRTNIQCVVCSFILLVFVLENEITCFQHLAFLCQQPLTWQGSSSS